MVWAPVSRKQHADDFGEFFSVNKNHKEKQKKTKNPTRSRKTILIEQGNGKLPPQSTGVRRLKGKARVCGARGPAAGGGARKAQIGRAHV